MKKYVPIILLLLVISLPLLSMAQGPGFGDDVDDVPVDGGLSFLVAAGIGYGAKKLKSRKKTTDAHA